jgi:ATP-dependent DNA helicase PIF1
MSLKIKSRIAGLFRHSNNAPELELSAEQQSIYKILESSNRNIFISGKAGTGKSLLLKYFYEHSKQRIIILAPTGIAALNVGGQTIHSFFKTTPFDGKHHTDLDAETVELINNIDAIVIDEISMVRADIIDLIDIKLRIVRKNPTAFGGLRFVMFGDMYQLPPIVSSPKLNKYFHDVYGGIYFFNAAIWHKTSFQTYELNCVFRQSGETFKAMLNSIREGNVSNAVLNELNKHYVRHAPCGIITLSATNKVVNDINSKKLNKITGKEHVYLAKLQGHLETSDLPVDSELKLKVGAQIMMIKNDPNKRWVNGSIGEVERLRRWSIKVKLDGKVYKIKKASWPKVDYEYDNKNKQVRQQIVGYVSQYPIRLAWAITIHKSQGQTYESCAIDLKQGVFAPGQAYVALSRCKNLESLYLLSPILNSDISVDPKIKDFMAKSKPVALG